MEKTLNLLDNIGIYKIYNIIDNKFYIGSSSNLKIRKQEHFRNLRNNKHINNYLQAAWNKYGEENFIFEILEKCNKDKLIEKEQYYLDTLKPEYNFRLIANNNLGLIHSIETKIKMSEKRKLRIKELAPNYGKNHSIETKTNMAKNGNNSKINFEIAEEIRNKYKFNNVTQKELAIEYDLYPTAISKIIRNERWKIK